MTTETHALLAFISTPNVERFLSSQVIKVSKVKVKINTEYTTKPLSHKVIYLLVIFYVQKLKINKQVNFNKCKLYFAFSYKSKLLKIEIET